MLAPQLPPLDGSTALVYVLAAWGAVKGLAKAYDAVAKYLERRRAVHHSEVDRETASTLRTREEGERLIKIQEAIIDRLTAEREEEKRRADAAESKSGRLEAANGELEAKLTTAARQWFEKQGHIEELTRRVEHLEAERGG